MKTGKEPRKAKIKTPSLNLWKQKKTQWISIFKEINHLFQYIYSRNRYVVTWPRLIQFILTRRSLLDGGQYLLYAQDHGSRFHRLPYICTFVLGQGNTTYSASSATVLSLPPGWAPSPASASQPFQIQFSQFLNLMQSLSLQLYPAIFYPSDVFCNTVTFFNFFMLESCLYCVLQKMYGVFPVWFTYTRVACSMARMVQTWKQIDM